MKFMNIFSEEQSETSSQYLAHENQSKTMKKRPPTNLKLGHGSRKGSWSTKRNEHKTFIQGVTTKTKLAQVYILVKLTGLYGKIEVILLGYGEIKFWH